MKPYDHSCTGYVKIFQNRRLGITEKSAPVQQRHWYSTAEES